VFLYPSSPSICHSASVPCPRSSVISHDYWLTPNRPIQFCESGPNSVTLWPSCIKIYFRGRNVCPGEIGSLKSWMRWKEGTGGRTVTRRRGNHEGWWQGGEETYILSITSIKERSFFYVGERTHSPRFRTSRLPVRYGDLSLALCTSKFLITWYTSTEWPHVLSPYFCLLLRDGTSSCLQLCSF